MKNLLRAEEAMLLAMAVYLNTFVPYPWWVYWAWFLAPDLSMIGYAVNTRTGAVLYNLLHHKGIAIALCIAGYQTHIMELILAGLVMLGHSAFDRVLGYGLKYPDNFKHTHLGMIGKP